MAIDKVLSKPIEAGLVPGVVAVAADDSGVIYEGAFGRRAVGSTEPMTLDSVFRIASMTKAIAGTAAMQLGSQNAGHAPAPADAHCRF
jgi:methyl acetate hydrolase